MCNADKCSADAGHTVEMGVLFCGMYCKDRCGRLLNAFAQGPDPVTLTYRRWPSSTMRMTPSFVSVISRICTSVPTERTSPMSAGCAVTLLSSGLGQARGEYSKLRRSSDGLASVAFSVSCSPVHACSWALLLRLCSLAVCVISRSLCAARCLSPSQCPCPLTSSWSVG